MGTWGAKLYQDDVAEDIKSDYKEMLQKGKTNEEAIKTMLLRYSEEIDDCDDGPVFWMVLADILWKYGRLTEEIKEKALKEIESGQNLKRWKEEGTQKDYEIRKKELERLKEKLNSPMPEEKKVSKFRNYKCEWKIGDTFAYKLESEYAKKIKLDGQYIIIRKVGEGKWYPEHIIPIVYLQITNNGQIPKTKEELDKLEYIKTFLKRIKQSNNNLDIIKIRYRVKMLNTSKRIIPKKLIYIGNYQDIKEPENEFIESDERNIWACSWNDLEKSILEKYIYFMENP